MTGLWTVRVGAGLLLIVSLHTWKRKGELFTSEVAVAS